MSEKNSGIKIAEEIIAEIVNADVNIGVKIGMMIAPREMGRRGGLIGGRIRAERLSPERRREIASRAAMIRWGKQKKEKR